MSAPTPEPIVLRAAAVWGTTVLTVRTLREGQSFRVGEGPECAVVKPDGLLMADFPIRAMGQGFALNLAGARGGEVWLRGRLEDPAFLARQGTSVPIVAGDYGLIQYGAFSVFFQFQVPAPPPRKSNRRDWALWLGFVFSTLLLGGGLFLIRAITTPPPLPKPLELVSARELAARFTLRSLEPPETREKKPEGGPAKGAQAKSPPGGAKKMAKAEARPGSRGKEDKTEPAGEPRSGLGGMAEVLSGDIGEEVKKTLGTISSVAEALGGLHSSQIVLGQGSDGLHGTTRGGQGDSAGVPFGSGTLETGWGAGKGGPGSGALGARGGGGPGRSGSGQGSEEGERKVDGKVAMTAGQGLSAEQIRRVVMSRTGAFQACYETAVARDPNLKGSVGVSFRIMPAGTVSDVTITNSSLENPRVEGCIVRQFNRLHFPTAEKPTNASFPFLFKPPSRAGR